MVCWLYELIRPDSAMEYLLSASVLSKGRSVNYSSRKCEAGNLTHLRTQIQISLMSGWQGGRTHACGDGGKVELESLMTVREPLRMIRGRVTCRGTNNFESAAGARNSVMIILLMASTAGPHSPTQAARYSDNRFRWTREDPYPETYEPPRQRAKIALVRTCRLR